MHMQKNADQSSDLGVPMCVHAHHVSCVPDDDVCEVLVCLEVAQHLAAKQLIAPQLPLSSVEANMARPGAAAHTRGGRSSMTLSGEECTHTHLICAAPSWVFKADSHSSHQTEETVHCKTQTTAASPHPESSLALKPELWYSTATPSPLMTARPPAHNIPCPHMPPLLGPPPPPHHHIPSLTTVV